MRLALSHSLSSLMGISPNVSVLSKIMCPVCMVLTIPGSVLLALRFPACSSKEDLSD